MENPPYHLKALFTALKSIQGNRAPEDLMILDHGCGGALTCLLLLANGYTGVHGIDLTASPCEQLNPFMQQQHGIREQRFFSYDGTVLPFGEDRFDFIFSQQVVEHIRPNVLRQYYSEEARVLRAGGGVYHEVPHRLTPYDSHTRTWFIHYLPRPVWLWLLKAVFKRDTATAREAIFLRWPWRHKTMARDIFGNVEDLTVARLRSLSSFEYYDGPVRLRKLMAWSFALPGAGPVLASLMANLVMLQTLSRYKDK